MRSSVRHRARPGSQANLPEAADLVFWGTAIAGHVVPQNDWAADFGRSEANILHPDAQTTAFVGDTDFTVATWVRPSNTAAYPLQFLYSQWNETIPPAGGVERKFCFFNDATQNRVVFGVYKHNLPPLQQMAMVNGQGLLDGRWYRLVGIHERGVGISFYVNDQPVGSTPWPHGVESGYTTTSSLQEPWLGGVYLGDATVGGVTVPMVHRDMYWRGQIGPTCYYTRVWTRQEIAWDYNAGSGRRYSEIGQSGTDGSGLRNGLVAFWQMTEEDTRSGPYLYTDSLPNVIIRRDSHSGGHHLTGPARTRAPQSVAGILSKDAPDDDDRIHQLKDRSPQGNTVIQADGTLSPYWDAQSEAVSLEPGHVFVRPNFSGLDGRQISLYLVSILKECTESHPWLHVSDSGRRGTGLKVFRHGGALVVRAWIGGRMHELGYGLSYPAERLVEVHYNGGRLSLCENGRLKASRPAHGRFDDPLNQLTLGPHQALRELLIYNRAHL